MKKKNYLTLDDEFIKYCELNKIEDIEKLAKEVFNRGFTILKYGDKPPVLIIPTKTEPIVIETPPIEKNKSTDTKSLYDE